MFCSITQIEKKQKTKTESVISILRMAKRSFCATTEVRHKITAIEICDIKYKPETTQGGILLTS